MNNSNSKMNQTINKTDRLSSALRTAYKPAALLAALTVTVLLSLPLFAQGSAVAGKNIFQMKGCANCHAVSADKKQALANLGPYIATAVKGRTDQWLKAYLKDPQGWFQKDATLRKNAARYAVRMVPIPLNDAEIGHIIAYMRTLK